MKQQIKDKIVHQIRTESKDSAEEQRLMLLLEREGDQLLESTGEQV